jgi:hypothetical protein
VPLCITDLFKEMIERHCVVELEFVAGVDNLCGFLVDELVNSEDFARVTRPLQPERGCVVLVLSFSWPEGVDRDGV